MSVFEQITWARHVLGIPPLMSWREIKQRYRTLSMTHHPDQQGQNETMVAINEAYEILKHYVEEYRFSFTDDEIAKQYPHDAHQKQFKF